MLCGLFKIYNFFKRHFLNTFRIKTVGVRALIFKDNKILLVRHTYIDGWYLPGGGVNAHESAHQAVVREVREEVGIEITNLRYFKSQPWPFPNSLMIAYFADYAGGTITPDPSEIEAADWFSRDALPLLPDPVSIARQLIEAALS